MNIKNMSAFVIAMVAMSAPASAQTPMSDPVASARAVPCAAAVWTHRTTLGDGGVAVGETPLNERTYYAARQRVSLDVSPRYAGVCSDVDDSAVQRAMCSNGWLVGRFCTPEPPRPTLPDAGPPPVVEERERIVYRDRVVYRDRPAATVPPRPASRRCPPACPPPTVVVQQPAPPNPPASAPPAAAPTTPPRVDVTPSGDPVRPPRATLSRHSSRPNG